MHQRCRELSALLVAVRELDDLSRRHDRRDPAGSASQLRRRVRRARPGRAGGRSRRAARRRASAGTGRAPPACTRTSAGLRAGSRSASQRRSPVSGSTRPKIARIAVVFPAPFGPRKPSMRPRSTVNEQPSSAVTGPNRLLIASTLSIVIELRRGGRRARHWSPISPIISCPKRPAIGDGTDLPCGVTAHSRPPARSGGRSSSTGSVPGGSAPGADRASVARQAGIHAVEIRERSHQHDERQQRSHPCASPPTCVNDPQPGKIPPEDRSDHDTPPDERGRLLAPRRGAGPRAAGRVPAARNA